jgi:hypothetical protein
MSVTSFTLYLVKTVYIYNDRTYHTISTLSTLSTLSSDPLVKMPTDFFQQKDNHLSFYRFQAYKIIILIRGHYSPCSICLEKTIKKWDEIHS